MGVLEHPKHELFAQELAKGKTATEAYVVAGYKHHDGNAATLRGNQRILDRVAEIQARGAVRTEITIESLTAMLLDDRAQAKELGQTAAAVSAVEKVAKLHGLMIDRKEIRTGELDELDAKQRDQLRRMVRGELERRAGGTGPGGGSRPH